MKAIQMHGYGGVAQLHYEEVPTPVPGPNEVLVKLAATSVNPIDWKIRRGDRKDSVNLQFPVVPGRDIAGEISAASRGASDFKPGQKVLALGDRAYAEFVVVPVAALAPVPEGLDIEQAGALPLVVSTGAELMDRIGPQRGDTVLVTGALGGVGRTAVYVALELGARVIVGVRAGQREQARILRAAQIVALDSDGEIGELPELDAIADTVNGEVIGKLLPKLKRGGVLGSVLGKPKAAEGKDIRIEAFMVQPNAKRLARMAEAVRSGKLAIPVARKFRLSEAAAAQQLAEAGHVHGKVLLIP
ncbi:MAG TPA: NADP-dependent oxidoreductase [Steroidobacteraceae bacterium]|jgi:NADPH:quinone reductase-like Zn-dependent oxidoreductase|nr:NADP-dependent oxidoreductase [Steroidobacteraceae bacterium]